ncbi:MAG: hypothetical protein ACD_46C00360G0005 [uncultured bacterium]|nr:MAG: hypothetical protein ACD_46C00360G0005 [uncultured bacterium]
MDTKKIVGFTLATAAAFAFAAAPVSSALAAGKSSKMPCYGVNSCKGKSQCKTATTGCKGQNECKGKGVMMTSKSKCEKMGGNSKAPE